MRSLWHKATLGAALTWALAVAAPAQILMDELPEDMQGVTVLQRRGEKLPLDLEFTDSNGRRVLLGDYFDGERPVVLVFGYLDCPMICDLVFTRAQRAFNEMDWLMGEEYRVLTISFDHTNTPSMAAGKQAALRAGYARTPTDDAWEFLVSDATNAKAVTAAAGFMYKYLPNRDEFSHPAALIIVSPDGVVSNYILGLEFPARQVRLALLDAADGKVGGFFDGFLHTCYIFDPDEGSYVLQAQKLMNIGAIATVIVIGSVLGGLFWNERRRRNRRQIENAPHMGAVGHA